MVIQESEARKKEDVHERYPQNGNSPKMALGLYPSNYHYVPKVGPVVG